MAKEKSITPMFSVVIPLYNKADTIERAVRSVVSQTSHDWELIVVNDGSTDKSLSVVRRMAAEIPIRIIDTPNGGVSSARNKGVEMAIGQYIAMLDADDVWYPRHLETIKQAIINHPDIGFFGSGYERDTGDYIYYTIPWGGCSIRDICAIFRYAQPVNSSTVVFDRHLWKAVGGFDTQSFFYEDYEFFFKMGKLTKGCVLHVISCKYTSDALQQTTKGRREFSRKTRPHWAFVDDSLGNKEATPEMRKYACTQIHLIHALSVINNTSGEYDNVIREFPNMAQLDWRPGLVDKVRVLARIRAYVFLMFYKLQNHIVLWRRKKGEE